MRARQALIEVWKEALHSDGRVWTPAGELKVANKVRVQYPRNATWKEQSKLQHRKIKVEFQPNSKYFPEPKAAVYSYRQYAYAQRIGLIEEHPRPKPVSPLVRAMRLTSGKPKKTPPPRQTR